MNQTYQITYKPDWCKHDQLHEVLPTIIEDHVKKHVNKLDLNEYIFKIMTSFIDRERHVDKVLVNIGNVVFDVQQEEDTLTIYPTFVPNDNRSLKFIFTNEDRSNGMTTHPEEYVRVFDDEFEKVSQVEGGLINPTTLGTIFEGYKDVIHSVTKRYLFKVWNMYPIIHLTDSVDSFYPSFTNLKPAETKEDQTQSVILEADYDSKIQTFIFDLLKNNVYYLLKASDLKLQLFIKPDGFNMKNLIVSRHASLQSFLDILKDFAKSHDLEICETQFLNFSGILKDSSDETYLNIGISFKQKELDLSFKNISQYDTIEDIHEDLSNHYNTLTHQRTQREFDYIDKVLTNLTRPF